MGVYDERLKTLDKAIDLCMSDLNKMRLDRDELSLKLDVNRSRLKEMVEERDRIKAHADKVKSSIRLVT